MSNLAISQFVNGILPTRGAEGAEVVTQPYFVDIPATPALTTANTIDIGHLPAGHIPIGVRFAPDDLDTNASPTLAFSLGILNDAKTDISTAAADGGAAWLTGLTGAQTAAASLQFSLPMLRVLPREVDRIIGLRVTGAPATQAAGRLRVFVDMIATP